MSHEGDYLAMVMIEQLIGDRGTSEAPLFKQNLLGGIHGDILDKPQGTDSRLRYLYEEKDLINDPEEALG